MTLEEQVSKQQLFKEIQFSLCEDVIQFENVMIFTNCFSN